MDKSFLKKLGLKKYNPGTSTGLASSSSGKYIQSFSPVDGAFIGSVSKTTRGEYEEIVGKAQAAFKEWREIPAPKRGEVIRQLWRRFTHAQRRFGGVWFLTKWAKAYKKAGAKCRK